jgi:NADPH:quinone reductase-like Zn-dependent oxidoreductase
VLAAFVLQPNPDDPLSALEVGERPDPEPREGWVPVRLRAASLNHHDLWSLRGVGLPAERCPMVLGCDGAGVLEDGTEVVVHAVVGDPDWRGDETLDPKRTLLSELHDGTLAEVVLVPRGNVVPKPAELSFEEAACLPTAWLTAYRMLFTQAGLQPGSTVLVQGAAGGVATAVIRLGTAAGLRVWVTSRDEVKRARALELGADLAVESGSRLPARVDAVMETVGAATWDHSMRALRPGGTVVVSGATSGHEVPLDLRRVFFLQQRVVGSTMGTRQELERLVAMLVSTGVRPVVDAVMPLEQARAGFARMAAGELQGKIVFTS